MKSAQWFGPGQLSFLLTICAPVGSLWDGEAGVIVAETGASGLFCCIDVALNLMLSDVKQRQQRSSKYNLLSVALWWVYSPRTAVNTVSVVQCTMLHDAAVLLAVQAVPLSLQRSAHSTM